MPYLQQFPYVSHSLFQLGNVGIAEMPGAVNAAADMVDVGGNPVDSGGQLFLLGVIDLLLLEKPHAPFMSKLKILPELFGKVLAFIRFDDYNYTVIL